jgi:hypothetical protein
VEPSWLIQRLQHSVPWYPKADCKASTLLTPVLAASFHIESSATLGFPQPITVKSTIIMDKNIPPPYSAFDQGSLSFPTGDEHNALMERLTTGVNEHFAPDASYPPGVQAILDRETERVRNMLEFTL